MDKTFHWAIKSPLGGPDYQAGIDTSNSIFQRDTVLLYASQCGKFPVDGPQQANAPWMVEHLHKIQEDMNSFIPDPNFSGLIVIDYEVWDLLWERTPDTIKVAWGNTGKAAYDAAAKAFYVATFNRIKELRPLAKVSFFGYPVKLYRTKETSPGVIGYGDGSYQASIINNQLAWLWNMEDFLSPNVYCLYRSNMFPDLTLSENTPDQDYAYVSSNTKEAVRLANGKPVYEVICPKYQRPPGNILFNTPLNGINITNAIYGPPNNGAGVMIWTSINNIDEQTAFTKYFHDFIDPISKKTGHVKIDRRPMVLFVVEVGNWNSNYKPEYNKWGYSNVFRRDGVQGVLNNMDKAIALGYRRLCIGKPIGTGMGQDVVAAAGAMHPVVKAEWLAKLPPWLAARKIQYPDLVVGVYTGSQFEALDSLACNQTSPNLKSAVDVSTPEALANFHACHDLFLIDLKLDFLVLDRGSTIEHGTQLIYTITQFPQYTFIGEAVRRQFENDFAMFARTTFWFQSSNEGVSPDAIFDPAETEIHWWLQQDFDVPVEGPVLLEYIKKRQNQGIIVSCQWPFGENEVIAATRGGGSWWYKRFIGD